MKKYQLMFILFLFLMPSCGDPPGNPGEIAFVNGTPITLKQLQAVHDQLVLSGDNPNRSYEALRFEYGSVLSELIVQELVAQELSRRDLSVTDEEVDAEIVLIRADFPPDEFERLFMEESIYFDSWREVLRGRLGMQKIAAKILRPGISISVQEVESYYMAHIEEFQAPERKHFMQFSGLNKEQLVAACRQFQQLPDPGPVQEHFPNLIIREVRMWVDRLAPEQASRLDRLKPMQASDPMELEGEFIVMVLLDTEKARVLTRAETYALVEGILLEDKIQAAFGVWLTNRLAKSDIKVSTHLLPEHMR